MNRARIRAAVLHVAADAFLIVFGAAFSGLILFSLMVISGGSID